MEKRGVSPIVATIILIFILMTIVSLIVLFSNNFFGLLQRDTIPVSPLYQKLKISMDSVNIDASVMPETMTITITREDNEEILLKGVRFKFWGRGNSYTYDVNDPPAETGISKPYTITNTDLNINTFSEINKVSVSAITPEGKQTKDLDEREI